MTVDLILTIISAGSYKQDLNPNNPLSYNGDVANEYAKVVRMLYTSDDSEVIPFAFKRTLYRYAPIFSDGRQHDTQEFLLFLLDGLQEDLNRIIKKPYIVRPDSTDEMVHNKAELCKLADEHWRIFKARNDSVITDLFAAMYKSTIVCPDCGKVSITFDPFTNLTLQLPKWQMESYVVHFFPLRQKPVKLDLEVSENSPVSDLRKLGVSKTGVDSDRLVMGEISQSKVFAMCDDAEMVSDFESSSSYLALFELESAPTDYVSETPEGATMRNLTPDFDSPRADRMLIPIFNRSLFAKSPNRPKTNQFFGPPSFIVVAREEAHDFDAIFRKVLAKVSTLTTRDFLNEDGQEEVIHEDSGTDVDDTDSADSKIKASSVEGEDGIVDISVRKEADKEAAGAEVLLGGRIPERLRNLFDIKVIDAGASVPVGPSIFENQRFRPMVSPEDRRASSRQGKVSPNL